MTESDPPDAIAILSGLKDFQRSTVELTFRRLWIDRPPVRRFLVADEVGLGKTMVAKGVIAKAVEHLAQEGSRLNIVYICSNRDIARQNLRRLNVVHGVQIQADRLSLLPKELHKLGREGINFIAFTPGTSANLAQKPGNYEERVLIYHLLARSWGEQFTADRNWTKLFQAGMELDSFVEKLGWTDPESLDDEFCLEFGLIVDRASVDEKTDGTSLRLALEECAGEFAAREGIQTGDLGRRRNQLIGRLRQLLATAAVEYLNAAIVILDEFQRFTSLLAGVEAPEEQIDGESEASADNQLQANTLAQAVFRDPQTRVLMLSATPFKMYTLPNEPEGDDHYQDFLEMVRFLGGRTMEGRVKRDLRVVREFIQSGGDEAAARAAHQSLEGQLRLIMTRTERLASTPGRSGMLEERELGGLRLEATDLRSWRTFDDVARLIDRQDVFEYWRSSPYPLNLMDSTYVVRDRFRAAADRNDPAVVAALTDAPGLLRWEDFRNYSPVNPGNAKLRALAEDVFERRHADDPERCSASQLIWLPPAMPYYELHGAYAEPALRTFTKRLVFSAWNVVPKAISVMLSYEAERRAVASSRFRERKHGDLPTGALTFNARSGRPDGPPTTLAILYPSLALARAGDPLECARLLGDELPLDRELLYYAVHENVTRLLANLPDGDPPHGVPDTGWYWVAPFLLDKRLEGGDNAAFRVRMRESSFGAGVDETDGKLAAGFRVHVEAALEARVVRRGGRTVVEALGRRLGARPADLADVLTKMAIASPGVCALRALARVGGGEPAFPDPHLREQAFRIATAMRALFNKPEFVAQLATTGAETSWRETYWRQVLDHALDGCLQSVLDEYAHVLVEFEGLQNNPDAHVRAIRIADAMTDALGVGARAYAVEDIQVHDGEIVQARHWASGHFAALYGDGGAGRRVAFNSPFRPFVLATTSVGQEGLDFHTYCHSVVHWNLPNNPVDLEQREGRVHRYKGHAVRKNVALAYGNAALNPDFCDPWQAVFEAAKADRSEHESDIKPYWVFTRPDRALAGQYEPAIIERYVPSMPLSRETSHYHRLRRTIGAYRLTIGQPRQEDLVQYMYGREGEYDWLRMDLSPQGSQSGSP